MSNIATEVGTTSSLIDRCEPLDTHELRTRQEQIPENAFACFDQEGQNPLVEHWRLGQPNQLISLGYGTAWMMDLLHRSAQSRFEEARCYTVPVRLQYGG